MKTYLSVPFKDVAHVKALGGRFDMNRKQWYCPDAVDLALFGRWLPGVDWSKWEKKLKKKPRSRGAARGFRETN